MSENHGKSDDSQDVNVNNASGMILNETCSGKAKGKGRTEVPSQTSLMPSRRNIEKDKKAAADAAKMEKARFAYEWHHRKDFLAKPGPQQKGIENLLQRFSSSWQKGEEGEWALRHCENYGMRYDVAVKEQQKWLEGQNEKLRREREVRAMQTEDSSARWMRVIAPFALATLKAGPAEGGVSEQPKGGG